MHPSRFPLSVLVPLLAGPIMLQGALAGPVDRIEAPRNAYESRVRAFLELSADGAGLWQQISKLELGRGPLDEDEIRATLDFMDRRQDTSDFRLAALVRIFYQYWDSPLLSDSLKDDILATTLAFRYWIDQPGQDDMVFWSENHQILFSSEEYLIGARFPDDYFSNAGWSGAEHRVHGLAWVEQWLDDRFHYGFSEWHSNVYYDEDFAAVQNLADFAPDESVRTRAAMILDLLHFDVGLNSLHGVFAVSHGRTYKSKVTSGRNDSVRSVSKLVSGVGEYNSSGSMSAVSLATSRTYVPPRVLQDIGAHVPESLESRERMGFQFSDAAALGLDFTSTSSAVRWWGMGGYAAWQTVDLTFAAAEEWQLWENKFFAAFEPLLPLYELGILPLVSYGAQAATSGSLLSTVDTYTYRSPDYMLACAQDHRSGQLGFQKVAWRAALDRDAVILTSHPGTLEGDNPGYWTGGFMPKVVQNENVLIAIYQWRPVSELVPTVVFPYNHAFFPREHFDEVREVGKWTFGRVGEGYIGLFSNRPTSWTTEGEWADRELIADGTSNVWICEMGRAAEDGSFDGFVSKLSAARIKVQGTRVAYDSPSQGQMKTGWSTGLKIRGEIMPIHNYPRYENPYCVAERGADRVHIAHRGRSLTLDFGAARRTVRD